MPVFSIDLMQLFLLRCMNNNRYLGDEVRANIQHSSVLTWMDLHNTDISGCG